MRKVILFLSLIFMAVFVSAQNSYLEQVKKEKERQEKMRELHRQRTSTSSGAEYYYYNDNSNNNSYDSQQKARRVRGTVFNGKNQTQVFLYVIDKGNSMYVTSYSTGKKDMYGQEFTYSVQQYAQRTSYQYDGEISQYYDWKISIGSMGNYVTCYF